MLVLTERLSCALSRPKYWPKSLCKQWVVLNTGIGEKAVTVYGPETRTMCQRYMQEHENVEETKDHGDQG